MLFLLVEDLFLVVFLCSACHISENRYVKVCLFAVSACSVRMLTCTTLPSVECRLILFCDVPSDIVLKVIYVVNRRISGGSVLAFSFYVGAIDRHFPSARF